MDAHLPCAVVGLRAYFDAQIRRDWDAAVLPFSEDVVYSHPPYQGASDLMPEVQGRAALRELLGAKPPNSFAVKITAWAEVGTTCLMFGSLDAEGRTGSYMAIAETTPDGEISFYAPFTRTPQVGFQVGGAR